MATPTLPENPDGSLREFTEDEIAAMRIQRRGVSEEGHVRYNLGPDGAGCTRVFFCAWEERFNAAIYFAGACKIWLDGSTETISRLVPQRDPDFPNWICTKVDIDPFRFTGDIEEPDDDDDVSEQLPIYDKAELRCVYEMVPFEVKPDEDTENETERYVTKPGYVGCEITTEANYVGLPGGVLQYVTDDGVTKPAKVPIPFAVGFTEPMRRFSIIWRRVPFDAWGAGKPLTNRVIGNEDTKGVLGSVNKTTFLGYWSLTLLLVGVEERLLPDPTGLGYSWDIKYIFQHKPVPFGQLGFYYHTVKTGEGEAGYYMVLRPPAGTGTIDANDLGDDDSLFPVREFEDLFQVAAI
ncbi:hypothetical protein VT84_05160 [Gemmata sp. SH-PL17]|uniref:hypothetical protein n=1 Tax=Gemmata sp. SH-PL17 TaxID=1630693 RepID=UPI0004BA06D3|nr:hypothetical protein [Gemmata sp. SH-PL17]AMV23779.1 hypothetical protein VT84_05160 [Gemmata sp. SH-PL17]